MRGWELLRWLGAFVAVLVMAVWLAQGAHIFTKDKRMVVHTEYDPLFGTTRQRVEWRPDFRLGLDIAGPLAALGVGAWVLGWWKSRKRG